MEHLLNQIKHNEEFHSEICDKYSDKFFDWKITCLFYCAYHGLQALACEWHINIGSNHKDILWNMNPRNNGRAMQVKENIFKAYDILFEYSRSARYNGFTDFDTFQQLKKADYEDALKRWDYIKKYIIEKGVPL